MIKKTILLIAIALSTQPIQPNIPLNANNSSLYLISSSEPFYIENEVLGTLGIGGIKNNELSEKKTYYNWLDKLAFCESSNREDIVVFDSNKRYSYGSLQFQKRTWAFYIEKYQLTLTDIMDEGQQKYLANRMLQDNVNNWKHWRNCTEKIGLPVAD